ncbi:MAG: hypothetical protein HGA99_01355 [Chlorobiaceae bacterium]|nr:hypothetical protein [Chlorobiaceae bacterium]
MDLKKLAETLHAQEKIDKSDFQRSARILQSIWREEQGYSCQEYADKKGKMHFRGSRLPMPWAQDSLSNFITDGIQNVVRKEVCNRAVSKGKLFGKPRIFDNLLSSQPLCFNLFAELKSDIPLATNLVKELTSGRFIKVNSIEFEYSPGRRDPKYLGDRSAFDVFFDCETSTGGRGFIGVEVKYHENLIGPAGNNNDRYDQVADTMKCFSSGTRDALKSSPLEQIWRDHLLVGAMCDKDSDKYEDGLFVILYPKDNHHVKDAVASYRNCLSNDSSFAEWTLEDVCFCLKKYSSAGWIDLFIDRYLAFEKVTTRLKQ